jgi:hypothetical protein
VADPIPEARSIWDKKYEQTSPVHFEGMPFDTAHRLSWESRRMKQERFTPSIIPALELKLFGDYALIVDIALNGDEKLKRRIAEADEIDRGGLAVLKNALRNRQVALPQMLADIMRSCEADQAYYAELQEDFTNIDKHGNFFRVRMTVGGVRMTKSFKHLREAQVWRDRMQMLDEWIDLSVEEVNLECF